MNLFVPCESSVGETRVALIPASIEKLAKLDGLEILVEQGLGKKIDLGDEAYQNAGASIISKPSEGYAKADIVCKVQPPTMDEVQSMKPGTLYISHLDPFNNKNLIRALAEVGISSISMEMVPRSTRAQKMDALSSQANLAGYVAIILAAKQLKQIFPMMTTPSGTISPARVFIIGAGVAGLQAIATAKRLGARVEAFDTRPVVEEQVQSLGAKFVKIDLGETGQTKDGYAKALTDEQKQIQAEGMAKHVGMADVVVTTAQLFGRPAPKIITAKMLQRMKPGSVLVDLAVETGGNIEGSRLGEIVEVHGVKIIGFSNLPRRVPVHSSQMYSNNVMNMISEFWDTESRIFKLDFEDEIINACVLTHKNRIRDERFNEEKET
ncbi:MAG: Re/Si-specific NAD(P)(+) transhydrogenase subunit alpha [Lentisphaeria bacterium]|nr:Re/Si-specific NAD(P)(+) transhydrogenase subunit alpha [Lentisphaeria bacterium]